MHLVEPPIEEMEATPRPANCGLWIECFLHHFKNRPVDRSEILEAAAVRHYSRDQVYDALKVLKTKFEKNHVACWWDSKERKEFFQWIDMSTEEHASRVDDLKWFESLPG